MQCANGRKLMNNPLEMDTVKLSQIEKIVKILKKQNKSKSFPQIDPEVSFEYVIGSLFPRAYQNMKDTCTQFYIQGYNEGKKENENNFSE